MWVKGCIHSALLKLFQYKYKIRSSSSTHLQPDLVVGTFLSIQLVHAQLPVHNPKMRVSSLLALVASGLAVAVPAPRDTAPSKSVVTRANGSSSSDPLSACPGYAASNVQKTDSGLTADLKLAGAACNAYGDDLTDLKLTVEYQTGRSQLINLRETECSLSLKPLA